MFPKGGSGGLSSSQLSQLMSQFGGGGASGGMGGGGMSGGLGGMSSSLGGNSIGGSSLGGSGGGMSGGFGGTGGNSFGGNRGGSGFGGNSGMGGQGQGQGNFVGRNGNQFVGANGMTGANLQGGFGSGMQNFSGGNRGGLNFNNSQNFNQNGGQQQQLVPIRARQRIAFDYTKVAAPEMQTQVQVRFNKLTSNYPSMRGVTFAADEAGLVVLSGEVKSASVAKLAQNLVRLEPGVRSVRNELTYPTE